MLIKPSLEKLLPKVDNRYTLALMIAKRARQLVDGAQPLIESDSPNLVTTACEELASNRIAWMKGQVNPYIPLRPEVEAARLAARTAAAHASMAEAVKDALDQAAGLSGADDLDESDADLIAESLLSLEEDFTGEDTEGSEEADLDEEVAMEEETDVEEDKDLEEDDVVSEEADVDEEADLVEDIP